MGVKGLGEYFSGYIIVKVDCLNPEKFINMSSRHGIKLWDIKRTSFTTIEFKMIHKQYKLLKKIIHQTGSKVKITRRHGIHFAYSKASKRKFFIAGIILFIGIISFMSSLIWSIDIIGNKKIDAARIFEALYKAGLKEGKIKYSLNLRNIENSLIKNINEISMVKISFKGTRAQIEIVERTMPPIIAPNDVPSNIVAAKEGVITKILTYKGQSVVKQGELVKPNQVLISGTITDSFNNPGKTVHAMGDVRAKTWYESIQDVNINFKYEVRSGKYRKKIYYVILGKKYCVKNSKINFEKYDKIEEKSRVKLKNYEMPVEVITEYYYEKIDAFKKLDYNEAEQIALQRAEDALKKVIPADAKRLERKIQKTVGNGKVKIRLLYIEEENIGLQMEIK